MAKRHKQQSIISLTKPRKPQAATGDSWWVRPREGFTAHAVKVFADRQQAVYPSVEDDAPRYESSRTL